MKTIIVIWGTAEIGKTTQIKAIFDKLNVKNNFTIDHYDTEIKATGLFKNKLIGIDSQGDDGINQGASLIEFGNSGCDIIICASRTKGATVDNICNISNNYKYEVIWTSHFSGGNNGIMPNYLDLNDEFASNIIDLINKL